MGAPLIGISGSIDAEATKHFLLRSYMRAVLAGGGVPLLLSPDLEGGLLEDCLSRLDGLLLAGGNDFDPAYFGQEPLPALGEVNPLRDTFEVRLIERALRLRMPVLGLCRGVQAMNVALGGSLWQDLPTQYDATDGPLLQHQQSKLSIPDTRPSHGVRVVSATLLSRVVGAETLRVNSFHHQAVRVVAPCLRVCAIAPDGVIEGVEHPQLPFFLGVQWHPERYFATDDTALALFAALREAAVRYGAKRVSACPSV